MKHIFRVATVILALGCGSESTAPKTNVSGHWKYSASNVSGSGISCNVSGVSVTLSQNGAVVTGSTTQGTIVCTIDGSSITNALTSEDITNGQINQSTIRFDIGSPDVHDVGTVTGNSMSGSLVIQFASTSGAGTIPISGHFIAVRE